MNTYQIIKELAKGKKISIRQLEKDFGYSNGYIGSWKKQTPNSIELARLADYFNVSVDYLLGRTEVTNELPISKQVMMRMDTDGLSRSDVDEIEQEMERYFTWRIDEIKKEREK